MNNLNLSPEDMNKLLKLAGSKLGKDPEQLKDQLESGNLNDVVNNLNPNQAQQINSLLQNPQALNTLLKNPKMLGMLEGFLGGKK